MAAGRKYPAELFSNIDTSKVTDQGLPRTLVLAIRIQHGWNEVSSQYRQQKAVNQWEAFMRMLGCAALAGLACISGTPANAQIMTTKSISAGMAMTMAQTALETCKTNGYKVSVTVVGNNGEVILQVRGDGTGPHTMENSMRKAYTARTTRAPSGDLVKRIKDNPQFSLVMLTNVIAAQGALPIKIGEDTIGAIGVSGAPGGEKDEACAKSGIDKVADMLK
jgi:uncharacterized protein GlcG (DUF336 family)